MLGKVKVVSWESSMGYLTWLPQCLLLKRPLRSFVSRYTFTQLIMYLETLPRLHIFAILASESFAILLRSFVTTSFLYKPPKFLTIVPCP